MKIFNSLILVCISLQGFCQINFVRKATWEEVSALARIENKLVFLHLEDSKCEQCEEVANQAFQSVDLKNLFAQNFISVRASLDTDEGRTLANKFEIKEGPVSLFVDPNGNVLNRFNGVAGAGFIYVEQADMALKRRNGKQLSDYLKEYNAGARSQKFLEEYIVKRRQAGMPVDELLEKYTGSLPLDSLSNFRIIKFIYTHGPSLDSKVYKAIQVVTPRSLIDSLYKSSQIQEAIAMNNAIISTTMKKAIENNDRNLSYQLSSFIQGTYHPDFWQGMIAGHRNRVRFAYEIKDTAQYIREAIFFLDDTHMKITADSLRKIDEKLMNPPVVNSGSRDKKPPRPMAPISQFFHLDLNEHAWHVFQMSSKIGDLERALKWSYQSIEFFNSLTRNTGHPMRLGNPAYLDTYAQLLYKLDRREEAIQWQTKAVEAQKITGGKSTSFEATLEQMRDGTLLK
jgi:thioredoxin-related protein